MQCPRCQHENLPEQKFCGECGTPLQRPYGSPQPAPSYPDVQREVEQLARDLNEALRQQTATSEILRVISSSPTDLQPVLDAVVESAARLCEAYDAIIFRRDGDRLILVAHHGPIPGEFTLPLVRGKAAGRSVLDGRTIHVADMETETEEFPESTEDARRLGFRTVLIVPLMREGRAIGTINLRRTEALLFSERQVALLKTFADQAVIAIENVRLLKELEARNRDLTEGLERETATGEILRVISSSPTDIQPVLDTVVKSAARLCDAYDAQIFQREGDQLLFVAHHGPMPSGPVGEYTVPLVRGTINGRAVLEGLPVHVADMQAERDEFPEGSELARRYGHRTVLSLPLMREGVAIGTISVRRAEIRPFTERQIALLQTFADQAVIAVENVRLFTELQASNRELTTALDQQTATSDILRVISQSQTNVQPVFDAIVASAVRLLGAYSGMLTRVAGDQIVLAALTSTDDAGDAALRAIFPRSLHSETPHAQAIRDRVPLNIADAHTDPRLSEALRATLRTRGSRSQVVVPLLRHDEAVGTIGVTRREPGGFNDDEIALLKTFADQAVIAIENVRLFNELEGRNRDLTATGEILRVISSSPTDVQPVFDAVAVSAAALCGAVDALIMLVDGGTMRRVAHFGAITSVSDGRPVTSATPTGRAIVERRVIHNHDILEEFARGDYLEARRLQEATGFRTVLAVPLIREENVIGVITIRRLEVRPFTEEQIALVKTFADQAVIAIENVRLFTELQTSNRDLTTALDTQTATSDILRVISRSPTDVQPVFDTIVRSAVRLCDGLFSALFRFDGELIHHVAQPNVTPEGLEELHRIFPARPTRALGSGRAILERAVVHIPDMELDPEFQHLALSRAIGFRSGLFVPMLREGAPIGVIMVAGAVPGPFSDSEIELLKTFADQAVIAVENVRLFTELEARNRDLTESLEQQTATADILRVISASPTDVQPVFEIIAERAVDLCDSEIGVVSRLDGELIHQAAIHGRTPADREGARRAHPVRLSDETVTARTIRNRAMVHIHDVLADPLYEQRVSALKAAVSAAATDGERARLKGELRLAEAYRVEVTARYRLALAVPMVRKGQVIGAIWVARTAPGSFSDKQIALLETFADQAVIAIENVRLFNELQARTGELTQSVEKLTALGEVSRAVSSTLDVETVLDTIVSRASQLAGAAGCSIYEYDEGAERFVLRATHNYDAAFVEALRAAPLRKGEGLMGRAAEMREPIQIPDITQPGAYQSSARDALIRFGYRALLSVPLLREDQIIGSLSFTRKAPGEFSPEVVEVLKTFATQSALAIQNARLFREIADKSRQLEAASRHKSEFLANMSHELRTPLNAIIGFSEVLTERMFGELNEKQDEYLKDIYASGQHLLSLINDILDLSKIEAGRMELEATDFDLPSAIDNALILVRERAIRRGITLGRTIDEQVGMLRGDERKVKQVLLNLLSNALKFTPEGGRIDVSARVHDGVAEVSVTDTGVGIAPEDQEAVFEEFRQVGTADKKVEGTGLGLALSRKFIELHGGRIWVKSEVGKGSTFTFSLPVT